MIFDTHAHYDDAAFDEDREEILSSMKAGGIEKIIDCSSDADSLLRVKKLTQDWPFMYGAYGLHPSDIKGLSFDILDEVRSLAQGEKTVAIGEIGLDYYWDKDNSRQQKDWFERQIALAHELSLPVMVHSREAAKDTVEMARSCDLSRTGADIHCFSYSKETARELLDMGLFLGIGGVVTFKNARKLKEVVEYAPLDRLLLETDCPYLAPEPFRGKRNCSLYIPYVVKKIAELKNVSEEEVIRVTKENALKLFPKCLSS